MTHNDANLDRAIQQNNAMVLSLDREIRALQERREALYERLCELKNQKKGDLK